MSGTLTSAIESKLKGLAPKLTADLRKQATAAGWPKKIVSSLSVVVDKDKVSISYPNKLAQEVEDLEYGKVGGFANAVMRKFTTQVDTVLDDAVVSATNDYAFSGEVLP
jgi:hypothetical protein